MTPIQDQIQQFKTLVQQNHITKKQIQQSLFFFESGSNDIFSYFYPFDAPTLAPNAYVQAMLDQVTSFVDEICKLGARRIALFSLGPVGCVPARTLLPGAPIDKCYGKMNKMVKNYNMGLESLVKIIPTKYYPGSFAVFGDVYKIVQIFEANPKHYGNFLHLFTPLSNTIYYSINITSSSICLILCDTLFFLVCLEE